MSVSRLSINRRDFSLCLGGVVLLAATAVGDAMLSRGLADPEGLQQAARCLARIPKTIGPWTSTVVEITDRELKLGGITGYMRREFQNGETGRTVILTVLCGPSGPLSVHSPTACFAGAGYDLVSGPAVRVITDRAGATSGLMQARFRPQAALLADVVQVFWGWSTDGRWDAPSNPRIAYRGEPVLFKLHTVDKVWESGADITASELFLKDALPLIRQALITTHEDQLSAAE